MAAKKPAAAKEAQENAPKEQPKRAKAGAFSPRLQKLHRGN